MIVNDIPASITAVIGTILRLTDSPQGMTSTVAIAETAKCKIALKRAEGALYGGWLTSEYRVLSALAMPDGHGPRLAPQPRAFARVDTGIVPVRWLAMDYLPGITLEAALRESMDAGRRAKLLRAFGQTLARIHATPPPPVMPQPTPSWLDTMLEEAGENLEHYNVDGPPQLLESLRSHRPRPVTPTLIHGDYTIDNVIVDGDEVVGVIDWSGGAVGDPRYDIALGTRPQHVAFEIDRAHDLEAFYAGYGSDPISQDDYDYFIGLYEFF
jgi:aminoglycoside phosphotransferase (APT) family kinase protein